MYSQDSQYEIIVKALECPRMKTAEKGPEPNRNIIIPTDYSYPKIPKDKKFFHRFVEPVVQTKIDGSNVSCRINKKSELYTLKVCTKNTVSFTVEFTVLPCEPEKYNGVLFKTVTDHRIVKQKEERFNNFGQMHDYIDDFIMLMYTVYDIYKENTLVFGEYWSRNSRPQIDYGIDAFYIIFDCCFFKDGIVKYRPTTHFVEQLKERGIEVVTLLDLDIKIMTYKQVSDAIEHLKYDFADLGVEGVVIKENDESTIMNKKERQTIKIRNYEEEELSKNPRSCRRDVDLV